MRCLDCSSGSLSTATRSEWRRKRFRARSNRIGCIACEQRQGLKEQCAPKSSCLGRYTTQTAIRAAQYNDRCSTSCSVGERRHYLRRTSAFLFRCTTLARSVLHLWTLCPMLSCRGVCTDTGICQTALWAVALTGQPAGALAPSTPPDQTGLSHPAQRRTQTQAQLIDTLLLAQLRLVRFLAMFAEALVHGDVQQQIVISSGNRHAQKSRSPFLYSTSIRFFFSCPRMLSAYIARGLNLVTSATALNCDVSTFQSFFSADPAVSIISAQPVPSNGTYNVPNSNIA
jgi:hypothetical protein